MPPARGKVYKYKGGSGTSRASSSSALQRGKACLNCRRRKMKCDGTRPVCGPCARSNRSDDCEYTDGQGRTRSQMLEDTISRLEARIQELEHPEVSTSSVTLHHPHSSYSHGLHTSPAPGYSQHSSPTSGAPSPAASSRSYSMRGASAARADTWDYEELAPHVAQQLIDIFFQRAGSLFWFLHQERFKSAMLLPDGSVGRPLPALLTILCLWGVKLSGSEDVAVHEAPLLSEALSQIGHALTGSLSHEVVQAIQAKLLLASYLFEIGRFLEGRHQTDAAASLALSCGFHKIRSAQPAHPFSSSYIDPFELTVPEPRDQIEEGERINAFWMSFMLDRVWAVTLGVPSIIADADTLGAQIDTPWPLEMETYERGQIYPNLRTSGTLKNFLTGINTGWPWENTGNLTQAVKASALFERATRLASSWRPGLYPVQAPVESALIGATELQNMNSYYAEFVALDQRIDEFKGQMPPLTNLEQLPPVAVEYMHGIHCLANAATIQLHSAFAQQNAASRAKCLAAGTAILRANLAVRVHDFPYLNPTIASMWAAVCRVMINEIIMMRSLYATPGPGAPNREGELIAALDQLQATMAVFAPNSALMNYQLGRIQQERVGI
ncbi:hypothetical protein OF83DRAFT_750494 [Amylostereum chailletii]|nr:hypothetical protein OF83DRAFT_750494 [Amylostereum chailletii]